MKVENAVRPQPEQIQEFLATEGPVCMVNLLRYRDRAEYADGRDTELSGQEAYRLYANAMKKRVEAAGGRFIFTSTVVGLMLGDVEDLWDAVGIVEYPSARSLVEIASSPDFHEIEVHREAGLAGQLNITSSEDSSI